ncbi:MAG TPA: PPC domain-containing protein, partial [Kofleriaceae bacterium]|nr:PPC domain-containing protein [Kofleriaceae bacterium]
DEIHLNKRAGYFTMLTINYLGSMNLADSANTYNIVPEAVRAGDVVLERWQRSGIGHTLVVKEVVELGEGTKDVTLLSGSMPRRQGKWESGVRSKQYFTSDYAGGVGANSDGQEYARLGGGLRRYRVTKNVAGYWTNTWMRADEAHWINSTDYARIGARPARFESMLGQVSPEQMKIELLAQIEDARRHLQQYPASCSARERRENGFRELYDVMERDFNRSRASVDAEYRALEDYVFAELAYTESKTCCWNSTTSAMFEIIMDRVRLDQEQADAAGECRAPSVFMNDGGYDYWRDHAAATGRAAQWVAWSEDEACSQRGVARDTEHAHEWTAFCSLEAPGGGETCGDAFEPNDTSATATAVSGTSTASLCSGDVDWYFVAGAATVTIEFSHAAGDLDMAAFDSGGVQVGISQTTSDRETLTVAAGTRIKVYGYQGATGAYTIRVQ